MLVVDLIDQLRGKFQRCRQGRSLENLSYDIQVSVASLAKFLAGENMNTRILRRIEEWCEMQHQEEHP